MRRIAALLAAAVLLIPATPASAARGSAADFAADCNDDGVVFVTGVAKYIGGTAAITRDCSVALSPGARLVFRNVDLSGTGALVAISSPEQTTIKVFDSVIDVAGPLELTAGCCAGDAGVPEHDGTVIVKNSTLAGESLQLVASFDWPGGKVVVRDSSLTGGGSLGVQVRASDLGGSDGLVRVVDSSIASGGDAHIATGSNGKTVARRNTFRVIGATTITTGAGGICRSTANTPTTPCT